VVNLVFAFVFLPLLTRPAAPRLATWATNLSVETELGIRTGRDPIASLPDPDFSPVQIKAPRRIRYPAR
jgi:hypothetical protein